MAQVRRRDFFLRYSWRKGIRSSDEGQKAGGGERGIDQMGSKEDWSNPRPKKTQKMSFAFLFFICTFSTKKGISCEDSFF